MHIGGLEAFVQSRGSNGRGFEARYWGLYPNCSGASISNPWTPLGGLSQIYHGPSTSTVQDVFNRADSHEVCRENRIHNLELNRLITREHSMASVAEPSITNSCTVHVSSNSTKYL